MTPPSPPPENGADDPADEARPPGGPTRRRRLWPLAIPAVAYCLAPLVANRVEPRIAGVPFLIFYVVVVTVVSPLIIWAVARRDPLYAADAPEPVPADGPTPLDPGSGPHGEGRDA